MDSTLLRTHTLLTTTPSRWLVITGTLPSDLLIRRPTQQDWSAVECLHHMIDMERVFQFRITCFLEGKQIPAHHPENEEWTLGDQSPSSLALELEELREQSLNTLETLNSADLELSATHSELGSVTLREMLNEWAAHDMDHTIQAERALIQPFIQNSGPWRVYFSSHDTQASGEAV